MDGKDYKPAAHVLDRLQQVDFVAVVGPTAAGKTTVMKVVMERYPRLHMVLVHTSRGVREGEQDGRDYWFRTRQTMEARIAKGGYAQVAPSIFGDLYATAPEDYSVRGISMMAVLADAMPTFRALPFRTFRTLFIVPPSWEDWQERVKSHSFTQQQLAGRLAEAKKSLEFALNNGDVRFVINNDLSVAAEDFATLALGKPLPARLQADQDRARALVRMLLDQLET